MPGELFPADDADAVVEPGSILDETVSTPSGHPQPRVIPKGRASPGGLLCDAVEASQVVSLWLAVSFCAGWAGGGGGGRREAWRALDARTRLT